MPPLRPLPDLVLITVFKMMTPNEQMVAIEMSPRCAVLVRAANRTLKTLVITDRNADNPNVLNFIETQINHYSLVSNPAMQPLMDAPDEPSFPHYPMTTPLSKWHCLDIELMDTATTEQIATIFSAVTDLKCIAYLSKTCERLVALLQHSPTWQRQLTHLMVDVAWGVDGPVACQLFTAINGLPALQYLAFDFHGTDRDLPDLSIFSQLKAVAIKSIGLDAWIWRSLERHAINNADLQVHLLSNDAEALFNLSQPLHSRIVRLEEKGYFLYYSSALRLCNQFRSLTSLSIQKYAGLNREIGPLFTAFSQLPRLVHLNWMVYFENDEVLSARSLTPLKSLRALALDLTITSHSQVQWLNLPVTMPNLQSIYMGTFSCGSCNDYPNWISLESPSGLNCLASSLCTLHFGVPLNRLILNSRARHVSVEKLLFGGQREPVTTEQN